VLLSVRYIAVQRVLQLVVLRCRSRGFKELEIVPLGVEQRLLPHTVWFLILTVGVSQWQGGRLQRAPAEGRPSESARLERRHQVSRRQSAR
jgi:hypothetical protein